MKAEAERLGFARCGLCPAEEVSADVREAWRAWTAEGRQGEMHWLERWGDVRFDPSKLVPGAKTVICALLCYHPCGKPVQKALSWYAQGTDYHIVMKKRLTTLARRLGIRGRAFADTAPLTEKYWAWRCGLGFMGRHTQLVVPGEGSAFFIGEIVTDSTADAYDAPLTGGLFEALCGECRLCEEACPTGAISGWRIDARRCLSYVTVEDRGPLPAWAGRCLRDCFWGCDRCMRACPHLHAPLRETAGELLPRRELAQVTEGEWPSLTPERWRELFARSAVRRAGYAGLMRNIRAGR